MDRAHPDCWALNHRHCCRIKKRWNLGVGMSEDPEMTSVLKPLVADAPYLPRLISATSWFWLYNMQAEMNLQVQVPKISDYIKIC